ncbi:unnamed protein product [Pieris macdunnoughi]|uniref:Uncharacterized protein n=1 Tax=Pieris macdunnoughi TaxID=345717 RepID=A0A821KYX4_9NEOP|nr:unnamed protein product [Pieris macdunnoughi]
MKVVLFNSLLTQLYDVHAPSRPVKVKHLDSPWLTDDIKSIMVNKNRAKAKLRSCDSPLAREKYKKCGIGVILCAVMLSGVIIFISQLNVATLPKYGNFLNRLESENNSNSHCLLI